jgi:hypothetical protein
VYALYLTFVRPRPEIISSVIYTILLPDDGQTNKPEHNVEITASDAHTNSTAYTMYDLMNKINQHHASTLTYYFSTNNK